MASISTGRPLHELDDDCLEKIFSMLSFRDIRSAELTCKAWKATIDKSELYRKMALDLCKQNMQEPLSEEYLQHVRELRQSIYQRKNSHEEAEV